MKITLPQVGESVTEAIIEKWLVRVGDHVEKYEPLAEVVTDKVSMELPSPASGVVAGIFVGDGQTVPMGTVIAELTVEGEVEATGDEPSPVALPGAPVPAVIGRTGILLKDVAPVGPTGSGRRVTTTSDDAVPQVRPPYSPAVLRLATQHGVDLFLVSGPAWADG